jgi:hypothetical protein
VRAAESSLAAPASGAWVDTFRDSTPTLVRSTSYLGTCSTALGTWTSSETSTSSTYGYWLRPTGGVSTAGNCATVRPIACCRRPRPVTLRGFTSAQFSGDLGGWTGAHQKCNAEFPDSFFCTATDVREAESPLAAPASGAWVDTFRDSTPTLVRSTSYLGTCSTALGTWTSSETSTSSTYGYWLRPTGGVSTAGNCATVRPIACCSRR